MADAEVLAEADVATTDVIGPGGCATSRTGHGTWPYPGSLSTFLRHGSHRLLAHRGRRDRLAGQLHDLLRTRRRRRCRRGDGIRLRRTPAGGFLAAIGVLVNPHPQRYRHDIAAHTATLTAAAHLLGPGTPLRICHDDLRLDPRYHHARARLRCATAG